jgi:hypothetical protein
MNFLGKKINKHNGSISLQSLPVAMDWIGILYSFPTKELMAGLLAALATKCITVC